jgi:hypothetical protein
MVPPFPALPEFEVESEAGSELSREILPELVAKEILPPFPALPEFEIECEYESEL